MAEHEDWKWTPPALSLWWLLITSKCRLCEMLSTWWDQKSIYGSVVFESSWICKILRCIRHFKCFLLHHHLKLLSRLNRRGQNRYRVCFCSLWNYWSKSWQLYEFQCVYVIWSHLWIEFIRPNHEMSKSSWMELFELSNFFLYPFF